MIKILILSHNVISDHGNMGKTIKSFFDLSSGNIRLSQIYLSNELPNDSICNSYFQITDTDVLKNLLSMKQIGNELNCFKKESEERRKKSAIRIKKGHFLRFIRDIIWKINFSKRDHLYEWIEKQKPDILFFASGNQIFSINLVLEIKRKFKIPLITFMGDMYRSEKSAFILDLYQRNIDKKLDNLIISTDFLLTASNKMTSFIKANYDVRTETYYRPYKIEDKSIGFYSNNNRAVYIGNLALGRDESLRNLAMGLLKKGIIVEFYSPKIFVKEIKNLVKTGLIYKGEIKPNDVSSTYDMYNFVIHVESFKKKYMNLTKYSYSTKIPELLGSHGLIIAYGPKNISSMEEFINHKSAICFYNYTEITTELDNIDFYSTECKMYKINAKKHLEQHRYESVVKKTAMYFHEVKRMWNE